MFKNGQMIGPYRLLEPVGMNAFSASWRAKGVDGRHVFVKLLRGDTPDGRGLGRRFPGVLDRARQVSVFRELCLVPVLEVLHRPAEGLFAVAAEFLVGQDLRSVRLPKKTLSGEDLRPLVTLLGWFGAWADALSSLHARGFAHGNLKPSNVFLEESRGAHAARLVDFEWAALGIGTRVRSLFRAPEHSPDRIASPLGDQWALGAMLGQVLADGDEPDSLGFGALPQVLVSVVRRAVSVDPAARFSSIREMAEQIFAVRRDLIDSMSDRRAVRTSGAFLPRLQRVDASARRVEPPLPMDEATEPASEQGPERQGWRDSEQPMDGNERFTDSRVVEYVSSARSQGHRRAQIASRS